MFKYPQATLDWDDHIGWCERTLDVCNQCPQCNALFVQRLDTRRMCQHPTCVPVQCARCKCWYALPKVLLVGKPSTWERFTQWLTRLVWGQA